MPLFDPARPVKATRAVSVRELARATSALLAAVERDGTIIALSRYGRMVALLTPVPDRIAVEIEGPDLGQDADEPDAGIEVRPEWLELGPVAEDILLHATESHPMPFEFGNLRHPGGALLGNDDAFGDGRPRPAPLPRKQAHARRTGHRGGFAAAPRHNR